MNKILIKTTEKVKLRNPISEKKYLPKGCVGEVDEYLYENQDYFYVNFQNPFPIEGVCREQVVRLN